MHTYNMWLLGDYPVTPEVLARSLADMLTVGLHGFIKAKEA